MQDRLDPANQPLVLVLDEEVHIRSLLHYLFEDEGIAHIIAEDLDHAEEIVLTHPGLRLVVLGLEIPPVDRESLLRQIQALPAGERPALIGLGHLGENPLPEMPLNAIFKKPLKAKRFMEEIKHYLLSESPFSS